MAINDTISREIQLNAVRIARAHAEACVHVYGTDKLSTRDLMLIELAVRSTIYPESVQGATEKVLTARFGLDKPATVDASMGTLPEDFPGYRPTTQS